MISDVSYKTFIGTKPWCVMFVFHKIYGYKRDYDGIKYLVVFGPEKYDAVLDTIRYLKELKSGIKYAFSHNYAKIKIDSDDDLPLEKTLTMQSAAMLIKSVFYKTQCTVTIMYSWKTTCIN